MEREPEALKKLEYLSLVSKICTELENHLGFGDKVLAEFITDLGRNCLTVAEFNAKLKENGADMPDYFVQTLLTIIHAILPPNKTSKSKSKDSSKEKVRRRRHSAMDNDRGQRNWRDLLPLKRNMTEESDVVPLQRPLKKRLEFPSPQSN